MSNWTWRLEVDEEGKLTIPQELLDQLGWKEDTELVWSEDEYGVKLERLQQPQDTLSQQDDS